jgi:hypothetical protein
MRLLEQAAHNLIDGLAVGLSACSCQHRRHHLAQLLEGACAELSDNRSRDLLYFCG